MPEAMSGASAITGCARYAETRALGLHCNLTRRTLPAEQVLKAFIGLMLSRLVSLTGQVGVDARKRAR